MSLAAKRRLINGLLAALTVWPLVHIGLARRYELSSWKLAGWGMYATPRFDQVGMEIAGEADGSPPVALTNPSPGEREAATRFLESYRWLRDLAPRTGVAGAVFAAHPGWRAIEIVVFRPHMDAATGLVRLERRAYRERRPG